MYLKTRNDRLANKVADRLEQAPSKNEGLVHLARECNTICYWRKANSIHRWFVDEVQDGDDDCESYEVSVEDLVRLKGLCDEVLASSVLVDAGTIKVGVFGASGYEEVDEPYQVIEDDSLARELLPTQEGFFFGPTDYDRYYLDDLEYTSRRLSWLIELAQEVEGEGQSPALEYLASW